MNLDSSEISKMSCNEYLVMLYREFCESQGINYKKEGLFKRTKEFMDWVTFNFNIKNKYAELLSYMLDDSVIGELDKGRFDSIVPNLTEKGYEAYAITPYASTFGDSSISVYNGKIVFLKNTEELYIQYESRQDSVKGPNIHPAFRCAPKIDTLITQLPIENTNVTPLITSSAYYNDIAIDAYGSTEDKNIEDKLLKLRKIREAIESLYCVSCEEELISRNGMYAYAIKSHQKQLKLEKILSR